MKGPGRWLPSLCVLLVGCARLPEVRVPRTPPVPAVENGQGPLPAAAARSLMIQRKGPGPLKLGREQAVSGQPLIADNRVTLLFDGPRIIAAMMAAVAAAQDSINLETYLFDQDPLGQAFADLLIAKQNQGVQVNIIYDCVGTLGTPQAFFDRMAASGIHLLPFHPVNPLKRLGHWRINNRDHRKILVVDGRVAFTGGVNLTAAYARSSLFRSRGKVTGSLGWRETHVRIEGPAVAALQKLFVDNWQAQEGGPLAERDYFPDLPKAGDQVLRVLGSWPRGDHAIYQAYLLAIQGAKRSINLTAAYFAPDPALLKALLDAARRGVEVKVLLPGLSDGRTVRLAGQSYYRELLGAGIRVYELKGSVLHAKTAVIDGNWSTVGSTNMDVRSFLHNLEANVLVLGEGFGQELERAFQDDLGDALEIKREAWRERSLWQRLQEWIARRLAYWL